MRAGDLGIDEAFCVGQKIRERARARLVAINVPWLIALVRPKAIQPDIGSDIHDDGMLRNAHFRVVVDLGNKNLVIDVARVTFMRIDDRKIEATERHPLHDVPIAALPCSRGSAQAFAYEI